MTALRLSVSEIADSAKPDKGFNLAKTTDECKKDQGKRPNSTCKIQCVRQYVIKRSARKMYAIDTN